MPFSANAIGLSIDEKQMGRCVFLTKNNTSRAHERILTRGATKSCAYAINTRDNACTPNVSTKNITYFVGVGQSRSATKYD